jgi:hypothetical protein
VLAAADIVERVDGVGMLGDRSVESEAPNGRAAVRIVIGTLRQTKWLAWDGESYPVQLERDFDRRRAAHGLNLFRKLADSTQRNAQGVARHHACLIRHYYVEVSRDHFGMQCLRRARNVGLGCQEWAGEQVQPYVTGVRRPERSTCRAHRDRPPLETAVGDRELDPVKLVWVVQRECIREWGGQLDRPGWSLPSSGCR